MEFDTTRRRVLELAGTGTALSVAGCSAIQGDTSSATPSGTDEGKPTVAVVVQPDQQKLSQRQQKIQSELQAGNISRREAQKRAATAQSELLSKAVATFRERAGSSDGLTIDESVDQFGAVLVSGSATALIDVLAYPEVNALVPETSYQQVKSQATEGPATPTPSG